MWTNRQRACGAENLPVATLTFPATPESDLSKTVPWSPLQFNAWNTLATMRPLGQIFRARKHVHKAHSEVRLEHIYDAKPGAMVDKAPFDGNDSTPKAERSEATSRL